MNQNEARVLRALAPGGQLTADQIARSEGIHSRAADRAIRSLLKTGMVVACVGIQRDSWAITPLGASFAETRHGRAVLDVPAEVRR
ncbi:helix-turn-helix domain-containing protein [Nocardia acidivorans]|uniref:helix-turn-helix domain-containing protein n=1 Tax=Nocardia acidivorans TaxID=404580 RepID=UPI000834321D|nr:helix-turn-helix domain-containing protein [Nocardia acidivorans]